MAESPGTFIREELDKRGWTQTDLARIVDRPIQVISEIVQGKKSITPDTANAIGAAFGTGAGIWLQREAEYRLAFSDVDTAAVSRRARLYDLAPIKEMEKRQWIQQTGDIEALEGELMRFFGVESLETEPQIVASMRRPGDETEPLTASQRAWCFRVRQLGAALMAAEYKEDRMPQCEAELRKVAAYPQEAHKVASVLASFGIRLVIVEPLTGCKVDGVAIWRDAGSPIIGLAARFDRIDNFWFTLGHELSHVRHRDTPHVDSDVAGQLMLPVEMKSPVERRADDEAAQMFVPKQELDSFILRVGPLYSKDKIIRFAHRIKMHPGVVVGQLQSRGEMGYAANREMLAKIRHIVLPATVTDGWGYTIDPRRL
ncbi:MAG: addiction module antidote protein, HigA family [Planctomycetota bacterium]|nr:MAG: addiction module antidote protein, HigA family [Planctomycetota bacterium]